MESDERGEPANAGKMAACSHRWQEAALEIELVDTSRKEATTSLAASTAFVHSQS